MAQIEQSRLCDIRFEPMMVHHEEVDDERVEMVVSIRSVRGSCASVVAIPEFSGEEVELKHRYYYNDSVDSLIGLGAFGVVYKGQDMETLNQVAIKKMARVHIKENELNVVKSLHSNYLIGVLDICVVDDITCCLIMELCDGDLEYHIKHNSVNGRLNAINLRTIIDNIARGYKALFDQRIVHRDIKPQNILVTYQGKSKTLATAKITDFGIARTLDDAGSDLCNVAGTLYYMAPEVGANLLKTCQYDSKVDMWSIGCLLYQCVTGEIPFDEGSLCRLFLYTAGGNYEAYDQPPLPTEVDKDVERMIHSLLEIDSSLRCTANQFYEEAISYDNSIC